MTRRRRYVSDAEGRRLAALAQEMGVREIARIRFLPNGVVEVFDRQAAEALIAGPDPEAAADAETALDAWEGQRV
jgi:hypothetical protein